MNSICNYVLSSFPDIVRKKSGDKYCLFFVIEDGLESHHSGRFRPNIEPCAGKPGQPIIFPTIGISSSITNSPIKAIV